MENDVSILTVAGKKALVDAIIAGQILKITGFKIGSAYGYVPDATQTDIRGSVLFNQNSPFAKKPTIYRTGDSVMEVDILLTPEVGTFEFGEYALFLADGTMFGISVLKELKTKNATTSDSIGNTLNMRFPIVFADAGMTVDIKVGSEIYHSLNVVEVESDLPDFHTASPNVYIVRNYRNLPNLTALAYKDYDTNPQEWRFISILKFFAVEEMNKVVVSDADGNAVASTYSRNKLLVLDEDFNINCNK